MANVGCSSRSLEGVIRGTNFRITGVDNTSEGLVQQFQLQFERKLSRVYDIASPIFYYIEGPSEGQVSFTKVVGPKGAPKLSCSCTPRDIILDAGQTLCYPNNAAFDASYTLKNALGYGLTGQASADNFLVVFGISYLFNDIA